MQRMLTKAVKSLLIGTAAMAMLAPSAYATNGMRVIGVGPVQRSMGGASVAMPLDAATTISNPAGMMLVDEQVNFGGSMFTPKSSLKITLDALAGAAGYKNNGKDVDSEVGTSPMPALGMILPAAEGSNMKVGVGAYGVAGMGVDYYDAPYLGNAHSNYSMMKFAPSVAMQFGDLSVGLAYNLDYASMAFQVPDFSIGSAVNSQFGSGFTVGAIYQLGDLNLGFAYETKQDFADFKFSIDNPDASTDDYGIVGMDQPPVMTFGIGYTLGDLKIAFDYSQIKWSEVLGKDQPKSDYRFNLNWDDQTVYKIGAQYQVTPDLVVRAGYNKGEQPVDTERAFETLLFPAVVETHTTFGAGYALNDRITLEFGYMIVDGKTVTGDLGSLYNPLGGPALTALDASTYETTLSETSMEIGVTAKF